MKIIKTHNYLKLSTDYNVFPHFRPTRNDEGSGKNIMDEKSNSKEEIKKRWKKKNKNKGDIVYQTGVSIPFVDNDEE